MSTSKTFTPKSIKYFETYLQGLNQISIDYFNENVPLGGHKHMGELIKYRPLTLAIEDKSKLITYKNNLWDTMKIHNKNKEPNTWGPQIVTMRYAYCLELLRFP